MEAVKKEDQCERIMEFTLQNYDFLNDELITSDSDFFQFTTPFDHHHRKLDLPPPPPPPPPCAAAAAAAVVPPSSSSSSSSSHEGVDQDVPLVPIHEGNRMCLMMETLDHFDLLQDFDIWDGSLLFDPDFNLQQFNQEESILQIRQFEEKQQDVEMAIVFLDWLKTNKESISAEDLRKIKLKRSTIDCAARRLGGGRTGMKQLLMLILEWIKQNRLQKKRKKNTEECNPFFGDVCLNPFQPYQYFSEPSPSTQYSSENCMYPIHNCKGGHGASATKEARMKRMARQRRGLLHARRPNNHTNLDKEEDFQIGEEHCSHDLVRGRNWMYCSKQTTPSAAITDRKIVNHEYCQKLEEDKAVGGKSENSNMRFLLQKVLKQSDVGGLGRIVLPKKDAEANLPALEARDGISMAIEEIGTKRVWNMRYRFWPNNKSRMYLLENTGDFVRSNGLQEGDFIVIYSDDANEKYMIRGVKVCRESEK